jgi:hypothetical protein
VTDELPPQLPNPRLRLLVVISCLVLAIAMVVLTIAQQLR